MWKNILRSTGVALLTLASAQAGATLSSAPLFVVTGAEPNVLINLSVEIF